MIDNEYPSFTSDNVYFLGDTHTLAFTNILKKHNLKDFILIHVGDAGEGFRGNSYTDVYDLDSLNKYCRDNNGRIFIVRGNHSNPDFYTKDHWSTKCEFVKFVPDYTYFNINGKVCLFVGGAVSIDRQDRILDDDYWRGEEFHLLDTYKDLPSCDILITHTSPTSTFPIDGLSRISGWFKNDPTLREELIKERANLQLLYEHVNCNKLYYGHFHHSASEYFNGCYHRCLNIDELVDATYEFR